MPDFSTLYAKLEKIQAELNPLVSLCDGEKQYREVSEKALDPTGFFYLRPVAVKDNYNLVGTRTTASSLMLDNYVAPYNASVVDKIIKQGGIILAKTSLDEFGMGGSNKSAYTGPVLNPFDANRISGGSSGGSAVLVATEIVDFALGSDTGDSVRKPAAFCGIVGTKPTYGLISRYGVIPYASSLDHVGFFTNNVKNAAGALSALSGRDDRDMTSLFSSAQDYQANLNPDLSGKKIAVLGNVIANITNSKVTAVFNDALRKLESRGARLEVVNLDEKVMRALLPVYYIISTGEASANHSNLDGLRFGLQEPGNSVEEVMINSRTKGFSSMIKKRFIIGSYCLFAENQERLFKKAQRVRRVINDSFHAVYRDYDAIIAPASGDVAPLLDEKPDNELADRYLISENYMSFANFMGLPSMTVPMGKLAGLPLGLNITTRRLEEQTMFDIGLALEETVNFVRWEDR